MDSTDFPEFLSGLQDIVGEENVVHHPDALLVFEYDGSVDRGLPEAVVFPANTEEVRRVLALAVVLAFAVALVAFAVLQQSHFQCPSVH